MILHWVSQQLIIAVDVQVSTLGKSLLIYVLTCQIAKKEYVRSSDRSTRVAYETQCVVAYHIELLGFTYVGSHFQR